jgi:hypothetical protein
VETAIRGIVGLRTYLTKLESAAPLVTLRVLFSLTVIISAVRFLALGWVHEQYGAAQIHFPYPGFEWLPCLPELYLYWVFVVMILCAIGMLIGYHYRWCAWGVFLTFTYIELLDVTYYLNHYYFVSCMALLLAWLPANARCSLDALAKPRLVPAWCRIVCMVFIGIVYTYAGVAKIHTDWLLNALPLKIWLPAHSDLPIVGRVLLLPETAYIFSWFGMIYDCTVVWLLLWKRTRVVAYVSVIVFHISTGILFQIGVFPVVMIAVTTIFFSKDWHENIVSRMERFFRVPPIQTCNNARSYVLPCVASTVFLIFHIVFPLRSILYPGDVRWHEFGYRFSWRVMLVEKAGWAQFTVTDSLTKKRGDVINGIFLNAHQEKQMSFQPDMIRYYAHWLKAEYQRRGVANPAVTAEVWVTLNGRPSKQLVNPKVNLAHEPQTCGVPHWIYHD